MVATVHVDIISERVGAMSHSGSVTALYRVARVTGLTDTDPTILLSALTACNTATPALTVGSNLSSLGYPANLVLTTRDPSLVPNAKGVVDVALGYEKTQGLGGLAYGYIVAEITSDLVESTRDTAVSGEQLIVSHVYPTTDPRYQNASLADRTKRKGVSVKFQRPQIGLRVTQVRETRHPELIAAAIAGKVNRVTWYGGAARTWLCTGVSITPQDEDSTPPKFTIVYTFQKNPQTWDAVALYTDDETGEPPEGIIDGPQLGRYSVQVHEDVNFEAILEARVYNG
jgi:hypothetical protein